MLGAALVALARGHAVHAAVYGGTAIASTVAALVVFRRARIWEGMGRAGYRRIGWSWAAIAVCHWAVTVASWDTDFLGAAVFWVTGLLSLLVGGTALTVARHITLVGRALPDDERPLAFCAGVLGEPSRSALLVATGRRVVAFAQPGLHVKLEELDAVERAEIVDVDVGGEGDVARVEVRTADRQIAIGHASPRMASSFARQVSYPPRP